MPMVIISIENADNVVISKLSSPNYTKLPMFHRHRLFSMGRTAIFQCKMIVIKNVSLYK